MLITPQSMRSLYTGFSAAFSGGFAGVAPSYARVATTVPSTTRSNEYGWLGQIPRVREWIGDRVINNLTAHGYTLRNKPFELTVGVKRDDIEDDNVGIYAPLFTELGRAAASFPDELVWPTLAAGFTTACYDGQYFFDTDHPVIGADGVTVSSVANTSGGSGTAWYLLDTSRAIKPLIFQSRKPLSNLVRLDRETDEAMFMEGKALYGVDGRCNAGYGLWQLAHASKQTLDAANYEAARAAMTGMKGDHARPLGLMPNLLVVPPTLEGAGRDLLSLKTLPNGGDNKWYGTAELHVCPWL